MTTIISKYGYGVPADGELAKGEIGIDLTDGIIYSSTDGSNVIELGRGEVKWENITGKPPTIDPDNGGDSYVDLAALEARVEVNEGDIAALKAAVADLESDLAALTGRVEKNEENIATNTGNITSNYNAIQSLNSQINDPDGLADQVQENTTNIGINADAIEAIEAILGQDLTSLYLGGTYDTPNNQVKDVTAAGVTAGIQAGDQLTAHTKDSNKGMYFVCSGEGTLEGTQRQGSDGKYAQNGDWLVSDGVHGWILMQFGGDHVTWGAIGGDINNQTDLQAQFGLYIKKTDTIDGGTYTAKR